MQLGLVVMAAGAGTRFGGGKLLAPFQGTPLYARALDAVPDGVFHRVAVVTAVAPMLSLAAARGFLPVVNDRPALGVSRTIALGLDALGDVDGRGHGRGDGAPQWRRRGEPVGRMGGPGLPPGQPPL